MSKKNKLIIICGHYGSGKTNLAINLALEKNHAEKSVTVVDMDVVNPYFRSSEYGALLSKNDIKLIAPVFAGTTVDTPTLPPSVYSMFTDAGETFIIDVGGDDVGITALGTLSEQITAYGYEMLYVINRYRVLSQQPSDAVTLLREIEVASHLKATGVVNNSHLGVETLYDTVVQSLDFAKKTAEKASLPLLFTTIPDYALNGAPESGDFKMIKRYVVFPWEREEI